MQLTEGKKTLNKVFIKFWKISLLKKVLRKERERKGKEKEWGRKEKGKGWKKKERSRKEGEGEGNQVDIVIEY